MYTTTVTESQASLAEKVLNHLIQTLFYGPDQNHGIGNSRLILQADAWRHGIPENTTNDLDALIVSVGQDPIQMSRDVQSVMTTTELLKKLARYRNELSAHFNCQVDSLWVDFGEYGKCIQVELTSEITDAAIYITFCLNG